MLYNFWLQQFQEITQNNLVTHDKSNLPYLPKNSDTSTDYSDFSHLDSLFQYQPCIIMAFFFLSQGMFYKLFANSAHPDQTAHEEQSDLGLYCWLVFCIIICDRYINPFNILQFSDQEFYSNIIITKNILFLFGPESRSQNLTFKSCNLQTCQLPKKSFGTLKQITFYTLI